MPTPTDGLQLALVDLLPEPSPLAPYKLDEPSLPVPELAPIEAGFRAGEWNLTRFDSIRQGTMSA